MTDPRGPITFSVPLASGDVDLELPADTAVLRPIRLPSLPSVTAALVEALERPIGTPAFTDLAREKLLAHPKASAVIVVSDNTRPVPYSGPSGILWPLVERLLRAGFEPNRITILVASGTHRALTQPEMTRLFDDRVLGSGANVHCHDAFDARGLVAVGRTGSGLEVKMNRVYVDADLRILTGLVESHLMAGASGGRKSVCPGLVGIDSIRDFHGASVLAHPSATDLVTSGNPCHDLSVEMARLARPHFIVNVTAREDGAVTGVFTGDMEEAHEKAVEQLRRAVGIPIEQQYDVVVTHAGKVGVNHYQSAKAALVAARAVEKDGYVVLVADTVDPDPVGSSHYRALMTLLRDIGYEAFQKLISSSDWSFVPDQWQVQMWARVFEKVVPEHFYYYSPQTPLFEYGRLPGRSPDDMWERLQLAPADQRSALFVTEAVSSALVRAAAVHRTYQEGPMDIAAKTGAHHRLRVAFLPAGPYGIPVRLEDTAATA